MDFIKGLKEELKTKRIPFTELKGENITPESLKGAMNHSMDNVFIPTSGTNVALIKLLPQLIVTSRDNPDYRMQLFGYPEWQTYTNDHLASSMNWTPISILRLHKQFISGSRSVLIGLPQMVQQGYAQLIP